MIYKDEIDRKAKEFQITPSDVQRDYLFSWILHGIFNYSSLKDIIFLKGGNALRKCYFENTRFSRDLDFGIPNDISEEILLMEINRVCDFVQKSAKIVFSIEKNIVDEKFADFQAPIPDLKVYEIRIYFKDFYGENSIMTLKVTLDLTRFDKVLGPIHSVPLIHPYSDKNEVSCNIRCMSLEEIIASKVKCLLQRQHAADLFDYAYSIKLLGGTLNKEVVVKLLIQKTIFHKNPYVLKDILKNISFTYFKMYWDKTIICTNQAKISVDEAIGTFISDLEVLFGVYRDTGFKDFAFFEAPLRIPIMDAGRNHTLLKVRYGGSDRLVEPYALKYQQKRDGSEREYLYVYNLKGGNSPPGMRCFIADKVESIENTDQKFVPRDGYQIELSKHGELPENPYLFDPNKPTRSSRSYQQYRYIKYLFKCSICGKRFTKSSMNNALGKHKNKNGYTCFNGFGIYLGTKF